MQQRNPRIGEAARVPSGWRAYRLPAPLQAELLSLERGLVESPPPRRVRRLSRRAGMLLLFVVSPLVLYACTSTLTGGGGLRLLPVFPDEIAVVPAHADLPNLGEEPDPDHPSERRGRVSRPSSAGASLPQAPQSDAPDLWRRIRAGLRFAPQVDNPQVVEQIRRFASDPQSLRMVQRRARPYLHFIVEEVERRHLPMELALLPIVESAFRPLATSEDDAAGIWQFIPRTGRKFGLEESPWYDERRDVVESTCAALDMLQQLGRSFRGDWELALASYNAGIGRVQEAQELNRLFDDSTDFWSLELPGETRIYVRRVLAIAQLVNRPQTWGIRLEAIPDRPYFAGVPLDQPLDLSIAAELAETPVHELYRLNPGLKRWTAGADGGRILNVPAERADGFRQRLAGIEPDQRLHTRTYKVREGDTLERIALRYALRADELRAANPEITEPLQPDRTLLIPLSNLLLDRMALLQRALESS